MTAPPRAPGELADLIEHEREYAKSHGFQRSTLWLSYEEATLIAAALRASGDGGEAMRSAAAEVVRYRGERARMALAGGCDGAAVNRAIRDACANMASEIHALPLSSPTKIEGADGNA